MNTAWKGIQLPKRPLASDIAGHPFVGERGEVRAWRVLVKPIAADARPGGVAILIAVRRRRHPDVMQRGKLSSNPRTRVVLIGNRIYAEFLDERDHLIGASCVAYLQQRLRQRVRSAPERNPQWTAVRFVCCADNCLCAF